MFEQRKTAYYRVNDPLEYLKIGVNIREGSKIGKDGEVIPSFSDNRVIDWQEKIFGPSEIARYLKSDEDDSLALVSQKETGRLLRNFEKSGKKATSLLKPTMIFTYVHKDNHLEPTTPPLINSGGMESYVGTAMSRSSHYNESTNSVDRRSVKVENRVFREKPYKVMYICLASDVDVSVLGSSHHVWDESMYFKHTILCEMRLYNDGLLEMTPGFSESCKEPYSASATTATATSTRGRSASTEGVVSNATDVDSLMPTEKAPKSVFMSNQTIIAGYKTGFRLSTHTVRTEDGHMFEFSLENMNALPVVDGSIHHQLLTPAALNTTAMSKQGRESAPVINAPGGGKSAGKGSSKPDPHSADMSKWKQDPPGASFHYTSTLYAEIVSACGFEGEKLFVTYEILYPHATSSDTGGANWKLRTGCLTDGVNAKDLMSAYNNKVNSSNMSSAAALGQKDANKSSVFSPLEISALVNEKESTGTLNGSTQVAHTCDLPGRYTMGSGCSAKSASKNSIGGNKYIDHFHILNHKIDQFTRIVLGLMFFIISSISVVLGITYPFWILPGLVIYFCLGEGMPGGGDILVMNDEHRDDKVFKHASHNIKNKVFQLSASCGITDPVAHFNYLLNCSFDVAESAEHRQLRVEYQKLTHENAAYATTTTSTNSANIDTSVDPSTGQRKKVVHMGNSQTAPTILFEVYSVGWFGRTRLEGYASSPLPLLGNTGEMELRTWKPIGSLYSRLYNYYIGCGARLYNSKFTGIVNERQKSINRFGVVTESSGTIRFKASMITCDPRAVVEVDMAEIVRRQQSKKLKQTAEDIVSNFKSTGSVASGAVTNALLRASLSSTGGGSRGVSPATSRTDISSMLRSPAAGGTGSLNAGVADSYSSKPLGAARMKDILSSNSQANSRIADIMARARGGSKPSGMSAAGSSNSLASADQHASSSSSAGIEMKQTDSAPLRRTALNARVDNDDAADGEAKNGDNESDGEGKNRNPKVKIIPRGGNSNNRTLGGGSNMGELKPLISGERGKLNMTTGAQGHPLKDRRYNRAVIEDDDE